MLREYQIEVRNEIEREWGLHDRVLLQMPTGTGKTIVFCEIVKRHNLKFPNSRILILVHKKELVEQTRKKLREYSIVPGIIMAGEDVKSDQRIYVATVQTLIRRKDKLSFLRNISLIVIDEAHHAPAETYQKLLSYYKTEKTKILGVTATPRRTDGEGFDYVFDKLVQSWSIKEFIDKGYLADVEHHKTVTYYDVKGSLKSLKIDKKTNDYDEVELSKLMTRGEYMSDAVESYIKYKGEYDKSIVFAVNITHSKELVERFIERGIKAAHIDGKTKKADREKILEDFRKGLISVLCNVGIVTEGFDCPDAEIVQLVRPTKSVTLYLQQVGRVLRPKGGKHALILDSACCYDELGSVKSDWQWTLEPDDKKSKNPLPTEPSEENSPPKSPDEEDISMVIVDEPKHINKFKCTLDADWLRNLSPEIYDLFIKLFPRTNSENELIQAIWRLKEIDFSRCNITSINGLDRLVNLQHLDVSDTNCESLRPIMNLNNLKVLNVAYSKASILRLPADNYESLLKLNVSGQSISDINLVRNYQSLTEVIADHTSFKSYNPFSKLPQLQNYSGNHSDFNSLGDLWDSRNSLRLLKLCNSNLKSLYHIDQFRNITKLDISYTSVTSLERIYLCRALKILVIRGIHIWDESLSELQKRRPDVWVEC